MGKYKVMSKSTIVPLCGTIAVRAEIAPVILIA
jgi:hypothetical protein